MNFKEGLNLFIEDNYACAETRLYIYHVWPHGKLTEEGEYLKVSQATFKEIEFEPVRQGDKIEPFIKFKFDVADSFFRQLYEELKKKYDPNSDRELHKQKELHLKDLRKLFKLDE